MAESSGFFNAEELIDGTYDREYVAEQWADYFKLFIGNGVFVSPTNQLKVRENSGLTVKVLAGWAWINGYWYHNDSDLVLTIPVNATAQSRTDGVFVRWDSNTRQISIVVGTGRTEVVRTSPYYELKLAEVFVPVGATDISDANIYDTRSNNSVCGFVTGVVDVIDSEDLFAQFTSIFNTWMSESEDSYDTWVSQKENDYNTWIEEQENSFEAWRTDQQEDFEDWFQHLQDELDENQAAHLQLQIDDIYSKLEQTAHPVTISVTTPPTKTTYNHGETLDLTGIVVTALYSDNHTVDITSQCVFNPADNSTLTDSMTSINITWTWVLQDLTIHYTTTQAIIVNKVLSSISVTAPTKNEYEVDEALDLTGSVVTATYTSGKTANVTSLATFNPANGTVFTEEGTVTITASYTENNITKTATTSVSVLPSYTIVSWAQGTDKEIAAMLRAHYQGLINIKDYWSVGDERVVSLSAMEAAYNCEAHSAQNVTLVLADVDNSNYTLVSDPTKSPVFIVQQKDSLTDTGGNGGMSSQTEWSTSSRRTWCNEVYRQAIPSTLRDIFKQVNVISLHTSSASTSTTQDYFFLPAVKEVIGGATASEGGADTGYSGKKEFNTLSQWEYYETAANRLKEPKFWRTNVGYLYQDWWTRSRYYYGATGFCSINEYGNAQQPNAASGCYFSPAGCI